MRFQWKCQQGFSFNVTKLTLTYTQRKKGKKQQIHPEEQQIRGLAIPDNTAIKSTVIKTAWYWHRESKLTKGTVCRLEIHENLLYESWQCIWRGKDELNLFPWLQSLPPNHSPIATRMSFPKHRNGCSNSPTKCIHNTLLSTIAFSYLHINRLHKLREMLD